MVESAILNFAAPWQIYRLCGDKNINGLIKEKYTAIKPKITAVVQPMSKRELRNVPEGQNALDWQSIWSIERIYLKDKIKINCDYYEIQKVAYWAEGEFWAGSAVKVEDELDPLS